MADSLDRVTAETLVALSRNHLPATTCLKPTCYLSAVCGRLAAPRQRAPVRSIAQPLPLRFRSGHRATPPVRRPRRAGAAGFPGRARRGRVDPAAIHKTRENNPVTHLLRPSSVIDWRNSNYAAETCSSQGRAYQRVLPNSEAFGAQSECEPPPHGRETRQWPSAQARTSLIASIPCVMGRPLLLRPPRPVPFPARKPLPRMIAGRMFTTAPEAVSGVTLLSWLVGCGIAPAASRRPPCVLRR